MTSPAQAADVTHRFHTGSFHPQLEAALADEVNRFRQAHGPLAPLLVLVPNSLLRVYLPRRLTVLVGTHANLRFLTVDDFVRSLLPPQTAPLPPFAGELIVDTLVREQVAPDSYFGPVREGAGFRAALLAAFRDLKQAGIGPAELRSACGGLDAEKFAQLAALYEGYEAALERSGCRDEDDLLRIATDQIRRRAADLPPRVLLYGFYDFNHLQRELIAALARCRPLTVLMPYHPTEAFRYAEPTRIWFEGILGVEAENYEGASEADLPRTLQTLRSGLFSSRALQVNTPADAAHFAIVSAPGEEREAREILRESVSFAGEGSRRLLDCAVLARHVSEYAGMLADCAGSRGYRLHRQGGEPLLSSAVAQAVRLLPRIVLDQFGRKTVLEFLSLAPIEVGRVLPAELQGGFLPATWGQISAEAGIVAGADSWRGRLDSWVRATLRRRQRFEAEGSPVPAVLDQRLRAARALERFFRALEAAVEGIPTAGPWSGFVAGVERAARMLLRPSEELELSLRAVRALARLEPFRPEVALEEFAEFVHKSLADGRLSAARFEEGGMFVGAIERSRGVTWPMVVIPGLVESSFPRVVREDPLLLDEEREAINHHLAAGAQGSGPGPVARLALKRSGHEEERLLFQLAVESARERLVLTYPRLDPMSGNPRVPSIFLLHVVEALRGGTANYARLEKDPLHRRVPLHEIRSGPAPALVLDVREHDLALIHAAVSGNLRSLRPYLDAVSPWLARGLACERRRWGTPRFTEFDGVFHSPAATAALKRRFEEHVWSATALERYARAPFEFFLTDVLGIEEFDDPEEAETISAKDLGTLWHDILRDIALRAREDKTWPPAPVVRRIAQDHFARFQQEGVTGQPLLWQLCCEKLLADLEAWLALERENTDYLPLYVEHPLPATSVFGWLLCGRVDRVDAARDGSWRVLDYKTGKRRFQNGSFCKGEALQIPLYMLALEKQAAATVAEGYYCYVSSSGNRNRVGWTRPQLREAEPRLRAILSEIVTSILDGRFYLTARFAGSAGVTMPAAAVSLLLDIKKTDPRWQQWERVLAEEETDGE